MKRTLLLCSFFGSFFYCQGQSYFGFRDDNYAGIQGVLFNPSAVVDSKYRADVTIFSASGTIQNDLYGVNVMDALDGSYDLAKDATKILSQTTEEILIWILWGLHLCLILRLYIVLAFIPEFAVLPI